MTEEAQKFDPQESAAPEVVVKLEPEVTHVLESAVKVDAVKDPAVAELVSQYKELEAKSEEHRAAKEEAQSRAAAAQNEAALARKEAQAARAAATSSNMDTITTALSSAQAETEAAKRDIKLAGESGDYDAQANAYERLAKATALAMRYDEAKADLESRKAAIPEPIRSFDPVEDYVKGRTEQTTNWLRQHREFVTDPRKNAKLTAAHHDAMSEGLSVDTKDYFDHVEKFIGLRKEAGEIENVQRLGAARKIVVRPVAPVNGSGGSGGAVGGIEVRLSAGEAAAAVDGTHIWNYDDPSGQKKFKKGEPIGVQEFARRKLKLKEAGQYDRTYETQ